MWKVRLTRTCAGVVVEQELLRAGRRTNSNGLSLNRSTCTAAQLQKAPPAVPLIQGCAARGTLATHATGPRDVCNTR